MDRLLYHLAGANGIQSIQRHLTSLGVYSKLGFIYPIYGIGEICQAFCRYGSRKQPFRAVCLFLSKRVCAVFGGLYILNECVQSLEVDESGHLISGIRKSDGQFIATEWLITRPCAVRNVWGALKDRKPVWFGTFSSADRSLCK